MAVCGPLLAVSSLGTHALGCTGFSSSNVWTSVVVRQAQSWWLTGSVVVEHRLGCSAACGIFPDQGSNPSHLHWQMNSTVPPGES